jgi:hypothetical protein
MLEEIFPNIAARGTADAIQSGQPTSVAGALRGLWRIVLRGATLKPR